MTVACYRVGQGCQASTPIREACMHARKAHAASAGAGVFRCSSAVQVTWGFEQHYAGVVSDQQRPKCILEPVREPGDFIRSLLDGLLQNVTALRVRFITRCPIHQTVPLEQQLQQLCHLPWPVRLHSNLLLSDHNICKHGVALLQH